MAGFADSGNKLKFQSNRDMDQVCHIITPSGNKKIFGFQIPPIPDVTIYEYYLYRIFVHKYEQYMDLTT